MIYLKARRKDKIKNMLCTCESCGNAESIFNNLHRFGENLQVDNRFNVLLNFLNTIGNRERLTIIIALKEKDRCVCELEAILDKSQPSISHHLRELEKINLIRGWKKGKFTYYSLMKEDFKEQLKTLNLEFDFSSLKSSF